MELSVRAVVRKTFCFIALSHVSMKFYTRAREHYQSFLKSERFTFYAQLLEILDIRG